MPSDKKEKNTNISHEALMVYIIYYLCINVRVPDSQLCLKIYGLMDQIIEIIEQTPVWAQVALKSYKSSFVPRPMHTSTELHSSNITEAI